MWPRASISVVPRQFTLLGRPSKDHGGLGGLVHLPTIALLLLAISIGQSEAHVCIIVYPERVPNAFKRALAATNSVN
jgi:hypothetical protein